MRANILPTALFAALILTAITSVRAEEATFEVTWLGKNDKSWTDSEVWDSATPEAWQTAIITNSSLIKFKAETGETVVSNIVVGANVSPTFQRADLATTGQHLLVQEMNGEGTLSLNRVGIHADYSNYDTCNISVAKIEVVANESYDSWFDGGTASGKRMIVNSDVIATGYLRVYNNVTLAGETVLKGKMQLESDAAVVCNLEWNGGNAELTSASRGRIDRLSVVGGSLAPATLPTGVSVGSIVLDGGTIVLANDYSGDIQIGPRGGFIQLSFDAGATPVLPSGLAFVEDDNLDRVVVKAAVGEDESLYTISKSGGTYALVDNVCVWIDTREEGDEDMLFHSTSNWKNGNVPGADSLAYFGYNVEDVAFTAQVTVSAVVVPPGVSVQFRTATSADGGKQMLLRKGVFGAGTLVMKRFGLKSDAANVDIAVAKLELPAYTYVNLRDCWLMSSENYPLRVASDISGDGFLKIRRDVTFSGDNSGFTGSQVLVDEVAGTRVTFESADSYFTNAAAFNFGVADAVLLFEFQDGPAEIGNMNISNAPTLSQRVAVTGSGADLACFVPGLTLSNGGVCDLSAFTLAITNPEDLPSPAIMRGKSLTLLSVPNGTLSGDVNVAGAPFRKEGEAGRWMSAKDGSRVVLAAFAPGLAVIIR